MSQSNAAIKSFSNGQFANIMHYHDVYFEASAWLVLAVERFTKAKEEGKDMGIAAGTADQANRLFQKALAICAKIPADYRDNCNNKVKQSASLSA